MPRSTRATGRATYRAGEIASAIRIISPLFGLRPLAITLETSLVKAPVRVAITGAAGQISYSLLFRIAAGRCWAPSSR